MSTQQAATDLDYNLAQPIVTLPLNFPDKRGWWILFAGALLLLGIFFVSVGVLLWQGVGIFGNNIPVSWAFPIINYVWFLGIGHAGTLISALLLLTGTQRRNTLNRFAEAMTLFAVVCAGLYPILHLGRPWLFYWMAPYPNTMQVWPNFTSPLAWDFFGVLGYLLVSVLFWYVGIIPDLATLRDRAKSRRAQVGYGLASLGWRGSARHWTRWNQAYRMCAGIAVPVVFLVTASYSLLMAVGPIPGWNSTLFPPYFLMGAVFSGFAVVAMIATALKYSLLGDLLTDKHFDLIGKLFLATGMMTGYFYLADIFFVLYSGEQYEMNTLIDRVAGTYAWSFWGAVVLNFVPLQLLWFRSIRTHPLVLCGVGLCATIGMWLERYMLLITSLYQDYLVSSWGPYSATIWDWLLFAGMIGLFLTPFLLFVRFLPIVSSAEIKEAMYEAQGQRHA